ncbi:CLUMA_CG020276, isoform A [Clunio marinus]|uniref:CLUMA_CG020276, isoform A n=1 Tax=Clunio marinus TaxID=568069 RepID=A0A1J1J8Q8_9DIPT|nr:CLUMA_CG020276, isoform A [Clunio marinus]
MANGIMIKFLFMLMMLSSCVPQKLRIPENLVFCYRENFTDYWYPQSLPLLIDIIRKIEASRPTSIDLRHLSARLFHDLRVDGIQRVPFTETEDVTPFVRNSVMSHKNIVLQQVISDVPGDIDYESILTPAELCTLHKLLSCSVEPLERQDELLHCPQEILNTTSLNRNHRKINIRPRDPSVHHRQPHSNFTVSSPNFSRCPIEMGVVFDSYGFAIHPGIIVANIASGLQPQQVKIGEFISEYKLKDPYENLETMEPTDTKKKIAKLITSLSSVDNTYASGLVGDMAEVVLFQGPSGNFTVGFEGMWNDTNFPRMRLLRGNQNGNWHLTDAEIFSGIDGIFMSQQVSSWISRIRRLRLSQIIEMFYLHQGISIPAVETNVKKTFKGRTQHKKPTDDENNEHDFAVSFDSRKIFKKSFHYTQNNNEMLDVDIKYLSRFSIAEDVSSVCHRKKIVEMIDVENLKEETYNFIQILEFVTSNAIMSSERLKLISDQVVEQTMERARQLVESTPQCKNFPLDHKRIAVDLTVIIDGSRNAYENLQFIHSISEMIDLSTFGSYISVIHGESGTFLVNRTNSVSSLFDQLKNSTNLRNPIHLSLSKSLRSLMFQLVNKTNFEKETGVYGALPKVCLVVSQSHRISEVDYTSAQRILTGTMKQFPDLYFVFLSNDIDTFKDMVEDVRIQPENANAIETMERYNFVSASSIQISTFKNSLDTALRSIPKRITSPFCESQEKRTWDDITNRNDFELYLTPNEEIRYRLSSLFMLGAENININFQGTGYGDFTVCMARSHDMLSQECKTVRDIENAWFNTSQPCLKRNADNCPSMYFSIQVDTTYLKCSEADCRFPYNLRIIVKPEGLRCERAGSENVTAKLSLLILSLSIMSFI